MQINLSYTEVGDEEKSGDCVTRDTTAFKYEDITPDRVRQILEQLERDDDYELINITLRMK